MQRAVLFEDYELQTVKTCIDFYIEHFNPEQLTFGESIDHILEMKISECKHISEFLDKYLNPTFDFDDSDYPY